MNPPLDPIHALKVRVYDPTGYDTLEIELRCGDVIEYKKNGARGSQSGLVIGMESGPKPLQIQPLGPTGEFIGRSIWRSAFAINHAWREGNLLGVPEPFVGRVLTFNEPQHAQDIGWVEVERTGANRNVGFNQHNPGWPQRKLSIGEEVRCEMRRVEGYRLPVWFVL